MTHNNRSFVPVFIKDLILALDSLNTQAQTTGITLRELSEQMGMQSTPQSDQRLRNGLDNLIAQQVIPGLSYSEDDGRARVVGLLSLGPAEP
jgi:hypothetical protein